MDTKKSRKTIHIDIKDVELYNKLKGKIYMQGRTLLDWFEEKANEEVYGKLEK